MARVKALEEEADAVESGSGNVAIWGLVCPARRPARKFRRKWAGGLFQPALSARAVFADLEKRGQKSGSRGAKVGPILHQDQDQIDPDSPFGGIGSGAGTGSTPKPGRIDLSDLGEILKLN